MGAASKEKHLIPIIKQGSGSLMCWGCFVAGGPEALVDIVNIFFRYIDILLLIRSMLRKNGCVIP